MDIRLLLTFPSSARVGRAEGPRALAFPARASLAGGKPALVKAW